MWMATNDTHEIGPSRCVYCNTQVPDVLASYFRCVHCNANYCCKEHKRADLRFHKQRCTGFVDSPQQVHEPNIGSFESLTNNQHYGVQLDNKNIHGLPSYQQQQQRQQQLQAFQQQQQQKRQLNQQQQLQQQQQNQQKHQTYQQIAQQQQLNQQQQQQQQLRQQQQQQQCQHSYQQQLQQQQSPQQQQNASQFSLSPTTIQVDNLNNISPSSSLQSSPTLPPRKVGGSPQISPKGQDFRCPPPYYQPSFSQPNSVDTLSSISPSCSGQSSPTTPTRQFMVTQGGPQMSPTEGKDLNSQYYQSGSSQSISYGSGSHLQSGQSSQSITPVLSDTQTVTIQNAPIKIQSINANDDDQVPLDDALLSFLQEAEQYDCLEDAQAKLKIPRNLSGIIRQREENLFYDKLLSTVDTENGRATHTTTVTMGKIDDFPPTSSPSTSSSSSLSTQADNEIAPRLLDQFKLTKQDSRDVIEGNLTLEEEGVFKRFNLNDIAEYIVRSLNIHNHCIIDCLHGTALAEEILDDVMMFHTEKGFSEGRLSSWDVKEGTPNKAIRDDLVAWTDGKGRQGIKKHMSRMDFLLKLCNRYIADCEILSRTQAMVACYPGNGTGYKQHIDNPNKDGRCITTLYYLNPTWNTKIDGGILRLFPSGVYRKTVNVEPLFDRLLFFWSDRRTPHEVIPAQKPRHAITLWYFNDEERRTYIQKYREAKTSGKTS